MEVELEDVKKMMKRIEQRIEKRISALEDSAGIKTDISEIVADKESIETKVINIANGVKAQSIVMDKNGCITINIAKEKDECGNDREYPWALYQGVTKIDTEGATIKSGKLVIK